MIDGVRIRLAVTVWNSTVDTPTAYATSSIDPILIARRGRMYPRLPRRSMVINTTTSTAVRSPSRMIQVRGRTVLTVRRLCCVRAAGRTVSAILAGPQQQVQENGAADGGDNDAHGDFVGEPDGAADDVAEQDEAGAEHGHPRYRAADAVAEHQRNQVGHHQAQEGNGTDVDHHHGADQRNDHQSQGHHPA